MLSPSDGLFATTLFFALSLCLLGGYSYRQYDQLGVTSLAACAGLLGVGSTLVGVLGLTGIDPTGASTIPLWVQFSLLFWGLSTVPWFLFSLQYTGRYTQIRRRIVVFLYAPFVIFILNFGLGAIGVEQLAVLQALATVILLYCLGLALVGAALLVSATYGTVYSPREASLLAVVPLAFFVVINVVTVPAAVTTRAAVYLSGLGVSSVSFAYVVWSGALFERTPAVETLGERAIARETDDIVFVVDDCDSVVKLNQTAVEKLDCARQTTLGTQLSAVLGNSTDELAAVTTTSLETVDGTRQYDPQVSTVADDCGTELGAVVSLRDVTERELREQRLSVLNRVLRHNLRNKVDVIKSRAEAVSNGNGGENRETTPDDYTETIVDTADELASLGKQARTIDRFVSESTEQSRVDITAVVDKTLERLDAADADTTVSVDTPGSATVTTNRTALAGALDSALDNALRYADSHVSVTVRDQGAEYLVTVSDDGPGIPDSELEALQHGTESVLQHGTGLGLWQLRWAVRTIDGTLSFETNNGTTVALTVPRS